MAETKVSKYTKQNVRRDLIKKIAVKAKADNRSTTNYVEQLLLDDLAKK